MHASFIPGRLSLSRELECNIGAFAVNNYPYYLGVPCYDYRRMGPQNPVLIIKAPIVSKHLVKPKKSLNPN